MRLRIQHRTTYRYAQPVSLGPHRMLLRPREGHDIHIERAVLDIRPAHNLRWIRDVSGNSIALVEFTEPASELMVYSEMVLNHLETNPFDFYIQPEAVRCPFLYDSETSLELAWLMQMAYPGDSLQIRNWLTPFWYPGQTVDTMEFLQQLNAHICQTFRYQIRDEAGVQSPAETLMLQSGSCRDFATLFIEACRCLGLGARFVSGYILSVGGSTHAWAEVYLPGGGWKGFDPTLGLLTTAQHVPVAVARHPENAMPLSGSFIGPASAFLTAQVDVHVEEIGAFVAPQLVPSPLFSQAQFSPTVV